MERRVLGQVEVRARGEGQQRVITGYAAVFDSLSVVMWGFRERIAKGAFAETLDGDVRALWNHDTNHVLGRTTVGTLRLEEDDKGLRVEIEPPDTPLTQSFLASIERGDVSQMSFAFATLEDSWDYDEQDQLIRTLRKVKLYEVSPVTFPAYTETEVGVRGMEGIYGDKPVIPASVRQGPRGAGESEAEGSEVQARFDVLRRRLEVMETVR